MCNTILAQIVCNQMYDISPDRMGFDTFDQIMLESYVVKISSDIVSIYKFYLMEYLSPRKLQYALHNIIFSKRFQISEGLQFLKV